MRELDEAALPFGLEGDPRFADRPFLRWRHRLHAWHLGRRRGLDDETFIALVERLEGAIARVDGRDEGFVITPLTETPALAEAIGHGGVLRVKDETGQIAGSHKARHLFGILLALEVLEVPRARRLAIASCGNAALAASVLAAAAGRPIQVFIPTDADPRVVARLRDLGAELVICRREPAARGDPTVHAFRDAVERGAVPFSCQGPDNGLTIEGGETLGWEIAQQVGRSALDRVFAQVGGGALGSALARGLARAVRAGALARLPRLHAVQTRAVHPFARAWDLVRELDRDALVAAARRRAELMRPWDAVGSSAAHGILDDETYDWLALVGAMRDSGGSAVVVEEEAIHRANELGRAHTGIAVDATGSAGLAGLVTLHERGEIGAGEACLVLFTGRDPG